MCECRYGRKVGLFILDSVLNEHIYLSNRNEILENPMELRYNEDENVNLHQDKHADAYVRQEVT